MSSSGGDGGSDGLLQGLDNPFENWTKNGKIDWGTVGNDILQPIRLGVHYDIKTGKLKDDSFKRINDVTGRSAAKKANEKAQNAIDQEKRQRAHEADLLWLDNYRRDVAGSSAAQGMRNTADARARMSGSSTASGKSSEDLLGV